MNESPVPLVIPSATRTASLLPTATLAPTETITPIPTETPTPESTATWETHSAMQVTAPILLYHHVSTEGKAGDRYYVSPAVFEEQMKALHDWGYTSMTVSAMAEVLVQGGEMPSRPVMITFDDGFEDVYKNAFPILQKYGFVATSYIIVNQVDEVGTVSSDDLRVLSAAGWEIGSHSVSHINLSKNHGKLWQEVANSRIQLEHILGVPVTSFSYPYGTTDESVVKAVREYGYRNAVGLGTSMEHTWATLYYLSREEVRASYDMDLFAALLPWKEKP
jgi:peptidoglycan/xylan/chitin deacetylase (PgdA/CDA1 family)